MTNANAAPVTDSVRIELASGSYGLSTPTPTALPITFAGPSLTLEAASGSPILDGMNTVRLLSVGSTSNVTIDGLKIESGKTAGLGGAIANSGALTVKSSTFSSNSAGNGGAISNDGALSVDASTFSNNTTTAVGGGAIIDFGTATVERSALIDNSAPINGGAINIQPAGTVTVTSSTFAGNTSGGFGGAMSNLGTLKVQGSTIASNAASAGAAVATGNPRVTLAATIVAAQSSAVACNPANAAFFDGGYNLDDDGTCISPTSPATGSHNGSTAYGSSTYGAALDAYLADAPANNGGPTNTIGLLNTPNPSTALADPALDVVPASFAPFAVDGVSAACALSDQRGVVPAAGATCDIGAYLLQATKTALHTPAAQVVQNASVTYTATVTPAPDGGTVAFDDGAGNPATARCAAQPLADGTAMCTASYASTGDYHVTATYSGDGAMNNFAPSASTTRTVVVGALAPPAAPPPVVPAPDRTPPMTTMRRVSTASQPITVHGTAKDAGSVKRVRVSVSRHVGKLCRFLRADRTFSKLRSCDKTSYVDAKGTTSWSLKLPSLRPGRYTIWSRGIDVAGNVERKNRARNRRIVRILTDRSGSTTASPTTRADVAAPAQVVREIATLPE